MSQINGLKTIGLGHPVPKHLKICVLSKYFDLKKCEPNRPKEDIICELIKTFKLGFDVINKIISINKIELLTSPKKKRNKKCKYNFIDNDYVIIDEIINDFNKQNVSPFISDVYRVVHQNPDCELTFKNCCLYTFYKKIYKMGYKYSNSDQLIRSEITNTTRIKKKLLEYLINKLEIAKQNPGSVCVF